jgi:hypothetical protein
MTSSRRVSRPENGGLIALISEAEHEGRGLACAWAAGPACCRSSKSSATAQARAVLPKSEDRAGFAVVEHFSRGGEVRHEAAFVIARHGGQPHQADIRSKGRLRRGGG